MVIMQLPNGTTCECALRLTKYGLRLVRLYASYDLLVAVNEMGWRIKDVKTELARKRLKRQFASRELAA